MKQVDIEIQIICNHETSACLTFGNETRIQNRITSLSLVIIVPSFPIMEIKLKHQHHHIATLCDQFLKNAIIISAPQIEVVIQLL